MRCDRYKDFGPDGAVSARSDQLNWQTPASTVVEFPHNFVLDNKGIIKYK